MAILQGRRAVVFGAGGSIGAAVAKGFAAEGAGVFLSGRTTRAWKKSHGKSRRREAAPMQRSSTRLDHGAVEAYIDGIAKEAASVGIVFNATGPLASEYGNGKHAVDLGLEEFMVPLATIVKSQFKPDPDKGPLRIAIGQLYDYGRFLNGSAATDLAVLTIGKPDHSYIDLLLVDRDCNRISPAWLSMRMFRKLYNHHQVSLLRVLISAFQP